MKNYNNKNRILMQCLLAFIGLAMSIIYLVKYISTKDSESLILAILPFMVFIGSGITAIKSIANLKKEPKDDPSITTINDDKDNNCDKKE